MNPERLAPLPRLLFYVSVVMGASGCNAAGCSGTPTEDLIGLKSDRTHLIHCQYTERNCELEEFEYPCLREVGPKTECEESSGETDDEGNSKPETKTCTTEERSITEVMCKTLICKNTERTPICPPTGCPLCFDPQVAAENGLANDPVALCKVGCREQSDISVAGDGCFYQSTPVPFVVDETPVPQYIFPNECPGISVSNQSFELAGHALKVDEYLQNRTRETTRMFVQAGTTFDVDLNVDYSFPFGGVNRGDEPVVLDGAVVVSPSGSCSGNTCNHLIEELSFQVSQVVINRIEPPANLADDVKRQIFDSLRIENVQTIPIAVTNGQFVLPADSAVFWVHGTHNNESLKRLSNLHNPSTGATIHKAECSP